MFLRQSTAQTIQFGPFLDDTDFKTAETGLTIAQADRQISKDGGAFAQSGHTGNSTHATDGWYTDDLSTADTNTVGELVLQVVVAGALPVWVRYYVVEEEVYDDLFATSGVGYLKPTTAGRDLDVTAGGAAGIDWGNIENPATAVDLSGTDIQLCDTVTTNTDMRGTDNAALASVLGALADAAAAGDPTSTDTVMAYLKQVINTLEGTTGIPVYPTAADPANNVSIAEALRAIRDDVTGIAGAAMRGTDSAALASVCTEVRLSELDAATAGKMANQVDVIETDTTANLDATVSSRATPAQVNTEVLDVLQTDTHAEIGQETPAATQSILKMIQYVYKAWRNRFTQTATQYSLYNDDATTVGQKSTVSDDGTTFDRTEVTTGP